MEIEIMKELIEKISFLVIFLAIYGSTQIFSTNAIRLRVKTHKLMINLEIEYSCTRKHGC